jgi:hypothetical protein
MKRPFNKIIAICTFLIVAIVFIIFTIAAILNQDEIYLLGTIIYWTLGVFAALISGLLVGPPEPKMIIKNNERRCNNSNVCN